VSIFHADSYVDWQLGLPCNSSEVMFRAHRIGRCLGWCSTLLHSVNLRRRMQVTGCPKMPTEEYDMAVESEKSPGPESSSRAAEPEASPSKLTVNTEEMSQHVWLCHDPVVQLREWATDVAYPLPESAVQCVIGSDGSADIRLGEPGGRVSRRHARLVRQDGASWVLEDLDSKNGSRLAGTSVSRARVTAGAEIGIGSFTLVAENQTLIRLRRYLGRLFGWDHAGRDAVDTALQALRAAATKHVPLSLVGAEDTVFIAYRIHRHIAGPEAPFVVCSPEPRKVDRWLRGAIMIRDLEAGVHHAAAGGTVCCRADDPPAGYDRLLALADSIGCRTLLMVSGNTTENIGVRPLTIFVPPLANRSLEEIERIVDECAVDALQELGAAPTSFTDESRAWVARHATSSFAKIELSTLRIIACNDSHTAYQASVRLGLSHVALGSWLKRTGAPTRVRTGRATKRRV
jgi:hypothetical protein